MNNQDNVMVFVAFGGKWEWDGKEWSFKEFNGSIMAVSKYVTLSQITDIICTKFDVDQDFWGLKLEVYYRIGFPIIEIECDEDLSLFISKSSKTELLLCVTAVLKDDVVGGVEEDEITPDGRKGTTTNNNEITKEGAMPSSSTTSGTNINYEGTTSSNDNNIKEGMNSTSNNNNIKEGMNSTSNNNDIKEGMKSTSNNNDMNEDDVAVFVAYNGKWEYDGKEWFFKNFKFSMMVVPKHITLSEITDVLHEQLQVDIEFYRLKLEVHYRTGSPWFPIIEIQNNQDLSVFISETSKTKLPLCVTVLDNEFANVDEETRKDHVRVLVAYDGKWRWDGEKWLFENSKDSIMVVSKYVMLSQITTDLYRILDVDQSYYRLKLEVHYRAGSPWFPIIEIEDDDDLSVFISESSKTKLPLCVTRVAKVVVVETAEHGREDDKAKERLINAIVEGDWVKAREIINTEEVTWTSKLNDDGYTALHYAVGRYKDNEVVRDILMGINPELLVTAVDNDGRTPAHHAALFGNTEALNIMLESNPKCLFTADDDDYLVIHHALETRAIKTFRYLFKQMKSYKDEYDFNFGNIYGLFFLDQVIDTGLIDVAYELINDYPSLATTMYEGKTALERIIRKPELFYSRTSHGFYRRFVYHIVPIENNSFGSNDTADVENQETPKNDKFVTKHTRRCLHDVISRICFKLWETTLLRVPHVKHLKDNKVMHDTTIKLLKRICEEADRTHTLSDIKRLYSSPFCLAAENNTAEAIDVLTTYFKGLYTSDKDGRDILQLIVLNRSEKVYNYFLHHERYDKTHFLVSIDDDGNNILHLVGRLAPIHILNATSGAALQMQRELQWFKEVEKVVGIAHIQALNKNKETPMMVFREAHEDLRKRGEEWMKKTAETYTITATLIITIVFAAAITVPGGNDSATGKPIYETRASLIIFAISDAISLFTSTTSLLLFVSILTARFEYEDFLYKLPKRLIYGLVMLFVSVTSMLIAFSAALYIMFGQEKEWILIPIAALASLPIASFVKLHFTSLVELISSTYGHGYFGKEKDDYRY